MGGYEIPVDTKVRLFPVMLVLAVVLMATGKFDPPGLASQPASGAAKAVAYAKRQVGKPYRWGATGPDSYDCSGLIWASWRQAGVAIPRTAAAQLAGLPRATGELRSGDLLVYASNGPSRRHVAMVVGPGRMIEALGRGIPVRVTPIRGGFIGAVRPRPPAPPAPPAAAASSGAARADIPADYLRLYREAGAGSGIPWSVLAGIGKVESNHGRSTLPGVHSGSNAAGACGPMQIGCVPGSKAGNSWATYGQGGSPYNPGDAIPTAARYLVGHGAPADLRGAIYGYNHASWYVEEVLAWSNRYTH